MTHHIVLRRNLIHAIAPALLMALMAAGAGAAEGGAPAAVIEGKAADHVTTAGRTANRHFQYYYPNSGPDTELYRRRTEMLERESLEESLRNLSRAGMYDERMTYISDIDGFRGMESWSIFKIVKNRRFTKVQGELRVLPAGEAAALINRELDQAVEDYRRELERLIGMWERRENTPEAARGIAVYEDDNYEGLEGKGLKVQALLLLAGEIGRADCATEIEEAVAESIAMRDAVRSNDALSTTTTEFQHMWGLMSPRIMTTALLRARSPEAILKDAASPFGLSSRNHVSDESWPGIFWVVDQMPERKFAEVLKAYLPAVEYRFELPEANPWR